MVAGGHWLVKFAQSIFTSFKPLLRMMDKAAINPPTVPAKAIAALFSGNNSPSNAGKYFVLNDEQQSSAASLGEHTRQQVWELVMADLEISSVTR
jgi:hypothetical protein